MINLYQETPDSPLGGETAVIMSSYGRDSLLEKAIVSVLNQSYKDFNLIIVDDNSPLVNSQTQGVIRKFAGTSEKIIFLRTDSTLEDKTRISTFSFCINQALKLVLEKGKRVKFVSYIACDDVYYSDRLLSATGYLKSHPRVNTCWNYFKLVDTEGKEIGIIPNVKKNALKTSIGNPVAVLDHNCVTHRLGLLRKLQDPYWPIEKDREHHAPDELFFLKLAKAGGRIRRADKGIMGEKLHHAKSIQGRVYDW